MAGIKALVALAFTGSIGLLFLFLACALPQYNNWYPFTVVIFYLLSPIPNIIARRYTDTTGENGQCKELAWFLTTGIVLSAFALPIVLSRSPVSAGVDPTPDIPVTTTTTIQPPTNNTVTDYVISGGACGLVLTANLVMFLTIFGFFVAFDNDDVQYSVW